MQSIMLGFGALCLAMPFAGRSFSRVSMVVGTVSFFAIAGAALGEAALRIVMGPSLGATIEFDERLLFRRIPGSTLAYARHPQNGGGQILTHINLRGFRGNDRPPALNGVVAVVYGDSFIEGYFSQGEKTFPSQLQACLSNSLAIPIDVLNAGVRGYGPDQVLLRMAQELPQLNPSLAIVALYAGNDFGDLLRNQLFRVGPTDALIPLHPRLTREMASELAFARHGPYLIKAIRKIQRRLSVRKRQQTQSGADSASGRAVEEQRAILRGTFDAYQAGIRSNTPTAQAFLDDLQDFDIELEPASEASVTKRTLMHAVLAALVERSADSGVPTLFVIIPSPVDLLPNYDILHVDQRLYPTFNPKVLTSDLDSALTALGAWHVNLEPSFRAHGAEELFMHVDDAHWSDTGQSFAARIVCSEVVSHLERNGSGK